ncbi:MAG TPA: ribonuclease III [Gammaproteobacteria bacterium]|nr:ribonuclease III [Gammaproteobacteria bacterium]
MSLPETRLAERLGYRCNDPEILRRALRHRSTGRRHNERLEFLGDAVLGLAIATELFRRDPDLNEGDLSRLRASLVNRVVLAEIAAGLALGDYLDLGPGELKSGGFRRKSILADTLEAVIGAIYVDGGYAAAHDLVCRLFAERLANLPAADSLKDPKTRLQEHLQARGHGLPVYTVLHHSGPAHNPTFKVSAAIPALEITVTAAAGSRRAAEQRAAQQILEQLEHES